MNSISFWYKSLSLRRRLVYSFNLVLFLTLSLIAVPALLNRVNNQFRDADNLLLPNLDELAMVLTITEDENWDQYKDIFYKKKVYNTGYASLISADGTLLIDPYLEGSNIANSEYFRQMKQLKRGRIAYRDLKAEQGRQDKFIYFVYNQQLNSYLAFTIDHKELIANPIKNTTFILIFAFLFSSLIFTLTLIRLSRSISRPLLHLTNEFDQISRGMLPSLDIKHSYKDELGSVLTSAKRMVDGLSKKSDFANAIADKNFEYPFEPLSTDDELGNALVNMRNNLQKASKEEGERKVADEKRNWSTLGLAKFSDILRQKYNDTKDLSFEIIKNIIKYTQSNQGGIFILNEDNPSDPFLELTGCYAFDRRKYLEKRIAIGEGLAGSCFREQKTTYMSNIPQDYIKITSGLGDENPSYLLLVPLTLNDVTLGVIELASFRPFEPHQIDFLEKLGESIASAVSSARITHQTSTLLAQSQLQAQEMKEKEEQLQQNLEELTATQEEANRRRSKLERFLRESDTRERELTDKIKELEEKLKLGVNGDMAG
jgi:methyl-accepting chemotaxis protein